MRSPRLALALALALVPALAHGAETPVKKPAAKKPAAAPASPAPANAAPAAAPSSSSEPEMVDGIAAQVGSDIVLVSEVTQLTAAAEKQARAQGATDADVAMMRSEVLERLIERRLLEQVVKKAELEASDAEVDGAIASIAKDNGLTIEQLQRSVEAGGLTFEGYRERIRGEIQRAKVLNGMVRSKVRIDEKELHALYDRRYASQPAGGEEVHLRHLLVTFGGESKRDEASACGQVQKALARIRGGEPFEDVAHEITEVNPETGGDVGWVHERTLSQWMAQAIAKLSPGQTSDVLRMPFGCNLLQLVEKREYKPATYEEAKPQLQEELYGQRTEEEYVKFMNKLRAQTYIERKGAFAKVRAPSSPSASAGDPLGLPPGPGPR